MSIVVLATAAPDRVTFERAEQRPTYLMPAAPDTIAFVEDKECGEVTVLESGAGTVVSDGTSGCAEVVVLDGGYGSVTISKGDGQPGPPGEPGPASDPYTVVEFQHDTPSPLVIRTMTDQELIIDSEIDVQEIFDDPAATLSLGTAADNDKLIAATENDPGVVAVFNSGCNYDFTNGEVVRLYINPGTSTQGGGRIIITTAQK